MSSDPLAVLQEQAHLAVLQEQANAVAATATLALEARREIAFTVKEPELLAAPEFSSLVNVQTADLTNGQNLADLLARAEEIDAMRRADAVEHANSRTPFQIEKFIGVQTGQTPAHTYHILRVQYSGMSSELKRCISDLIVYQREYAARWADAPADAGISRPYFWGWRKEDEAPYWRDIDKQQYESRVHAAQIEIRDRTIQCAHLEHMMRALEERNGGPFSAEQLRAEEPEYWTRRLSAQSTADLLSRLLGIGSGNVHALLAAVAPSITPSGNIAPGLEPALLLTNNPSAQNAAIETILNQAVDGLFSAADPVVIQALFEPEASDQIETQEAPALPLPGASAAQ